MVLAPVMHQYACITFVNTWAWKLCDDEVFNIPRVWDVVSCDPLAVYAPRVGECIAPSHPVVLGQQSLMDSPPWIGSWTRADNDLQVSYVT